MKEILYWSAIISAFSTVLALSFYGVFTEVKTEIAVKIGLTAIAWAIIALALKPTPLP